MEFRAIKETELPQAKALWKQAFEDSDTYIDFNFSRNLDLSYSIGAFDGVFLACMLFMIKKNMACTLNGKTVEVYFIVGVATDKTYQRQGIASKILEEANRFLFNLGVPAVYLYPFNHQFYKKQGYHTVSWMKKVKLEKSSAAEPDKGFELKHYTKKHLPDAETLGGLYKTVGLKKHSFFIRTKQDFIDMMETMAVDDGRFIMAYQNDEPVGYVFYFLKRKKIIGTEALFLDAEAAKNAVSVLAKEYSGYIFLDDSFDIQGAETAEYAMMKIINFEEARRICGAASVEEILGVEVMILEQY